MTETTFHCRACGSPECIPILSFGTTPLADALLSADQLGSPEVTAPLDLVFCPVCSLVQITETVPPEILFCRNYPYFSSVSKSLLEHFAKSAEAVIQSRGLNADSLVIEAASNDGYMLRNFREPRDPRARASIPPKSRCAPPMSGASTASTSSSPGSWRKN